MLDQPAPQPHVLDDPPPYHSKLLGYGERPYWSPDGKRIAFIERNYGDVCEIDLATRVVRNITHGLGEHHTFLRVLYLHNGDYLLIGPREFKHRDISRHVESELWLLDKAAQTPPVPLGRRIFEGAAVSIHAPRIAYAVTGRNDPSLGAPDRVECHVTEIEYGPGGPRLGADRIIYRTEGGYLAEPQDFRRQDTEVILAAYDFRRAIHPHTQRCGIKGVEIATGKVRTYINEPNVHNECEGIFPDGEHCCLESSCDMEPLGKYTIKTRDLWKLKLDGSGRRVRMTHFYDRPPRIVASPNAPIGPWHTAPWLATNSNVSPDGRWLAFMVNLLNDEAGFGRGLGLLDLAAWEASPEAQEWEVAPVDEEAG